LVALFAGPLWWGYVWLWLMNEASSNDGIEMLVGTP
jgi:hypothetical protein